MLTFASLRENLAISSAVFLESLLIVRDVAFPFNPAGSSKGVYELGLRK